MTQGRCQQLVGQGEGEVGFGVPRQVVYGILEVFCHIRCRQLRAGGYGSIGQEIEAGDGHLGLTNSVEGGVCIEGGEEIGGLE